MPLLRAFRPASRRAVVSVTSSLFLFMTIPIFAQSASPKLSVMLTPLGAAAKEKMLPVTAVAGIDIVVKNEGADSAFKITLTAKLDGLELVGPAGWKADGDAIKLEIPEIKAAGQITRRLNLRVAAAPLPPGRTAEIAVEIRSGGTNAQAQTKIAIADCATAFHAQLTRVRVGPLEDVRRLADEIRKPDAALPRGRLFRAAARKGDLASLERLATLAAARGTADPEFSREGMRYTVVRWTNELRGYTGQDPNPGLCAGNYYLVAGYRQNILPITQRTEAARKASARALALLRRATNSKDDETLPQIAARVAEAAGVKIDNPPAATIALLARVKEQLKDKTLSSEQSDQLALVETVAWLDAAGGRAGKLADAINRTIDGMTDAQKQTCVCAF